MTHEQIASAADGVLKVAQTEHLGRHHDALVHTALSCKAMLSGVEIYRDDELCLFVRYGRHGQELLQGEDSPQARALGGLFRAVCHLAAEALAQRPHERSH